jgi:CBS domain-containing protein
MTTQDEAWVRACQNFEGMTVAEADRLMTIEPTLIHPDETLIAAIRRVVEQPACRVLCVVDPNQRLLGLLPIGDLAFAAFVRVMPEVFMRQMRTLSQGREFAAMLHSRTVGDAMRPALALRPADRLEEAFAKLLDANLEGLPIVDDRNRVIGYLNLPEFLSAWLAQAPADAPTAQGNTP